MILIPFFLIVIALLPYSDGVHGTTYSYGNNDYEFNGEITDDNGHFKGDIYIDENTGWVFCNGKVRFFGKLHIKNADIDYSIDEEDYDGSMFTFNSQEVTLDGTEGEMEEGFPFYFLGFFGSAIGFIVWLSWIISKKGAKYDLYAAYFSSIFGLLSITIILYIYICLIGLIITIPIFILMRKSYEKYSSLQKSRFIGLSFILGISIIALSIISITYPNPYGSVIGGGTEYNLLSVFGSIFFGIIGSISSAVLIGFGIGKISYQRI
jgi:hypothetical protein